MEALRRFDFATVLTPLNPKLDDDPAFREAYAALVAEVQRQDAGLMTIKTLARRNWPGVGAGESAAGQRYATWYEPLDEAQEVRAAVSWVLSHEEVTGLASAGDVRLLGLILRAERDRLTAEASAELLREVDEYASPFVRMPA